jgi:uncharacterized protein (TIGR02996 family)
VTDDLRKRGEIEGFLAAIRENPDDDTTRLALSDWLQDHYPEETELIAAYRRSYADLRAEVVALCDSFDESRNYEGRGYGYMDPDDLIQQATECAAGRHTRISLGAAEDLTFILREEGEDWDRFWKVIEILSGYRTDQIRESVSYSCSC